jgi:predicted RNA binding protein YcfA (HicA-like mRNA interferase family)
MKTNEFIRRLKAAGCRLVRHGGDHDIWYSPITGQKDRVPRHGSKEVKKGLLQSLEKKLLGL